MEEKETKEQYVNVVVKNEQEGEEEIQISFVGIFLNMKRFFALWLVMSLIVSILIPIGFTYIKQDNYKAMQALVCFTYDGVEKGLTPDGNKFNADTMKNPQIIAAALEKLGLSATLIEKVRMGITIKGIVPQDAMERITAYKNIFAGGGSTALTAADLILDTSYYSTQYTVSFDYAATGLSAETAESVLNKILESYGEYFLRTYGFNEPLGNAIKAMNYEDYDYAEAVELFDSTLSTLKSYVDRLSKEDFTRFRSSATGYTFADLSSTISMLKTIDLDMISSYITLNTVTKDKDSLTTYYRYMVEELERKKIVEEELLATITESITNYEKNVIMFVGANGTDTDNVSLTASGASEQYDRLFMQKIEVQEELSRTVQRIDLYEKRLERLKNYTITSSATMRAKAEGDLARLNEKIHDVLEAVNATTEEYYKTVVFANAFDVLVPANASVENIVKKSVQDSLKTVVIADALLFVGYLAIAVVLSCAEEYKKTQGVQQRGRKAPEPPAAEHGKEKKKK